MRGKLLISFSGGRTSAYMTWWLQNIWKERDNWEMVVVYANTGKEREETLEFIRQCDRHYGFKTVWIEAITNPQLGKGVTARIVDFKTASRNGEPFEQMIAKHGIPNQNSPHCSRELKKHAIKAYMRVNGLLKAEIAIGIRSDEADRINPNYKKERIIYPLIQYIKTTKSDVNKFWSWQPFDLKIKSYEGNCDLCWKKSFRKLMTITKENPKLTDWWSEIEEKYGNYVPNSHKHNDKIKLPARFYRNSKSINEILSDSLLQFDEARDESKDIDKFKQIDLFDESLDNAFGCIETCEAF